MIQREYFCGVYTFYISCDKCRKTLPHEHDFSAAVKSLKTVGWKFYAPDKYHDKDWQHYCPECSSTKRKKRAFRGYTN